ncbi:MAG: NAD+ synthase [Bdellovibrio sp.]|nr:NAD+ synthase [Bdellovibrio sp.]
MRIALAQINPTLAGFEENIQKSLDYVLRAKEKKAELVIFPEASLFGYHPFDLLERESLVDQQMQALKTLIAKIPKGIYVIVGGFEKNKNKIGRPYYNAAFLIQKNKLIKTFHKELLPTGDVFDEARFIEKGNLKDNFFLIGKKKFFLTICEDIWAWKDGKKRSDYVVNPIQKVKRQKVDLVINLSASPFYTDKLKLREFMVQQTAKYFKAPMVYVNIVGGQDEIIFDGQSFLVSADGKKKLSCLAFEEDLNVFELSSLEDWNKTAKVKPENETAMLRKALVLGMRDFLKKSGLKRVHFGLSGGIDSALLACLAADAYGPQNVSLFALPTQFNHKESFELAEKLAKNLNINLKTISIQSMFEFIKNILDAEFSVKEFSLMHENLQSRLRGLILMAYSNFSGSMLLTTGNKSEYATGYATLYGDMCGGLAPLGDLTKKQIVALSNLYNEETELIPKRIITRPPSAELKPDQKDQDFLPAYDDLDASVVRLVEKKLPVKGKTDEWLSKVLMRTEFKRWQAAPILKVSEHSFGRGRRYPLAHKATKI